MPFVTGIIVFFLLWWILFLVALPIGVKTSNKTQKGNATSAPENPKIKKKALLTTGLTLVLFLILYAVIESDLFSFRRLVTENPPW